MLGAVSGLRPDNAHCVTLRPCVSEEGTPTHQPSGLSVPAAFFATDLDQWMAPLLEAELLFLK